MRINENTMPEDLCNSVKEVMFSDAIPNILLTNEGNPNGFTSDENDYNYWIKRVCEK